MFDLRTILTTDNATEKTWHKKLSPSAIELDRRYVTYESSDFRVWSHNVSSVEERACSFARGKILTVIPSPTPTQYLGGATCGYKKCSQDGADDTDDDETVGYRGGIDKILRHPGRWRQQAVISNALTGRHVDCSPIVPERRKERVAFKPSSRRILQNSERRSNVGVASIVGGGIYTRAKARWSTWDP